MNYKNNFITFVNRFHSELYRLLMFAAAPATAPAAAPPAGSGFATFDEIYPLHYLLFTV